ncbi:DUF4145 domain-containing protein [Acinetobacter baumannii]|uniref:DUF4145 domain-containing protein n=1 Tax=Acinetobacter baumannii TaxID=470 RepID=UPI00370131DF
MIQPNPNKSINSFVFDCPVCNVKHTTFDVKGWGNPVKGPNEELLFQLFSVCRACKMATCITATVNEAYVKSFSLNLGMRSNEENPVIPIMQKILTEQERDLRMFFSEFRFIPVIPNKALAPEYLPPELDKIFNEASKCLAIGCFNASAAMFRLCLDVVTKGLVDLNDHLAPSRDDKKTIHNRLNWIFKNRILNSGLEDLSRCIKDDGNDGAHDGNIGKDEADDLFDFTYELLEQVYTQPERIRLAQVRRQERRKS